jgi:RNA polymerase sigma factor (sigma-70 family)
VPTAGEPAEGDSGKSSRLDSTAVAALYEEHAPSLRAFLVGVLKNADLAGEALQATFAKAVEAGHAAREETLKGWLFKVAFNEAMLLRRRSQVHERSIRKLAAGGHRDDESPIDDLCRQETVERVKDVLESLPDEQRRIVRMRIYEEKTFAAIAAELGIPLGTALTRMRLAVKKLGELLGPNS